jgi:1-acyl-sn-glycerol-3-phosphate acyltransferase
MLKKLSPALKGVLNSLFLILHTIFWCTPLYVFAFFKVISPTPQIRSSVDKILVWIGSHWITTNNIAMALTHNTDYQIPDINNVKLNDWYFIISNHQSWADILILQKLFLNKAPFIRFFIKKELFWVPVIGIAWWALDFPFMARHSKAAIAKNPNLKTKDLETTRNTCAKFQYHPVSILNFLEGTRFTPAKRTQQQSPYQNLLKPRMGGFANAIYAMDKKITHVLDVTIVYPSGIPTFWDFLCGRINSVKVDVQQRDIPSEFLSWTDLDDPQIRNQFGEWVNSLWQKKEQIIHDLSKSNA